MSVRAAKQVRALERPDHRARLLAGVDEAGRGPLAGPVSAAAVVLDPGAIPGGLDDSKKLTAQARERLQREIQASALYACVVMIDADEIDSLNILNATLQAMERAVAGLGVAVTQVLVDGNRAPGFGNCTPRPAVTTLIGGDGLHASIAAASILAKCARDERMVAYDAQYPGYGFAQHKGYPTAAHREALTRLGPCPIHRTSYAPVRRALEQQQRAIR